MFLDWLVFLGGILLGSGIWQWGHYRGRQFERRNDSKPQVHQIVHLQHRPERTRLVPLEQPLFPLPAGSDVYDNAYPVPVPWGPQYIVDNEGRLWEVTHGVAPTARYIGMGYNPNNIEFLPNWRCTICGNIERGDKTWCQSCGCMRGETPDLPLPKWIERGDHH